MGYVRILEKAKKQHTVVRLYIRIHFEVRSHTFSCSVYAREGIAPYK